MRPPLGARAQVQILGDRYLLGEILGEGGMGIVHRAHDLRRGQDCALKLLHPWRVDTDNVVRFKREFRAAARLDHPHCLRVFDLEVDQGRWFFTMELAPAGCLQPGRFRHWPDVIPVALQVLAALDHIHARQIVHRDVKPGNILLSTTDPAQGLLVRLADFGVSQVAGTDQQPVGQIVGSLAYLAPEQLDGHTDHRSDLYSLGLVLYEALTGENLQRVQIDQRSPAQAIRSLRTIYPGLRVHARGRLERARIPEHVADVVWRLLAIDPDERPRSAAAAHDQLSAWWQPQPQASGRCAPPAPPLARAPAVATPRFVGRDRERQQLGDFVTSIVDGSASGMPAICFVHGPAGVGKSRLVGQIIPLAEQLGMRVEAGTWRAEGGGPWAVRGLFRAAGLHDFAGNYTAAPADTAWLTTTTSSASGPYQAAPDEAGIETELTANLPLAGIPGGDEGDEAGRQWSVYRRIVDALLDRACVQPLLFILEDGHWADQASADLLAFVIRSTAQAGRHPKPRLGFVITHRPGEDQPALARLREVVAAQGGALELPVCPLELDGAAAMVGSMLMEPVGAALRAFAGRLLAHARGNPLYLSQTVHLLVTTGRLGHHAGAWDFAAAALLGTPLPRSLEEAIGDRAARLSIDTKRALAAAAVVGRHLGFEILAATCGLDPGLLLDCLDESIRAGFLSEHPERPGSYLFAHEGIREAILASLPEADRREQHRAVAMATERLLGRGEEQAEGLAHHWEEAGESARAHDHWWSAARFMMATFQFSRAADHFERAVASAERAGLPQTGDLLRQRGDACLQSGRYAQALSCFEGALLETSEPMSRAELLRKCAETEYRRGNTVPAGQQLDRVLTLLGRPVPRSSRAAHLIFLKELLRLIARRLLGTRKVKSRPDRGSERERLQAVTYMTAAEVLYFCDRPRAVAYMLSGLGIAERLGSPAELVVGLGLQGVAFAMLGLRRLALGELERARPLVNLVSPSEQAWHCILRALVFATMARMPEYIQETGRAIKLLEKSHEPMKLREAWALHGEALESLGATHAAEAYASAVLRLADELVDERGRGWGLGIQANAATRLGQHQRARVLYAAAVDAAIKGTDHTSRLIIQARQAFGLLLEGSLDEGLEVARVAASEMLSRDLRHPSAVNFPVFLAAAALKLRRDGALDPVLRREVARMRRAGRRFAAALRMTAPLYHASLGALAMASGRQRAGRAQFARAIAIAEAHQLRGDLCDVIGLATLCFPEPDRAAYQDRLRRLRERCSSVDPEYPLPKQD